QKAAIDWFNSFIQLNLDKAIRREDDDVVAALLKKLISTIKTRGLNNLNGRYFRAARLIAHRYGLPYASMVQLEAAFILLNETNDFIDALKEEKFVRDELAAKAAADKAAENTNNKSGKVENKTSAYDILNNVLSILNSSVNKYTSGVGIVINAAKIGLGEVRAGISNIVAEFGNDQSSLTLSEIVNNVINILKDSLGRYASGLGDVLNGLKTWFSEARTGLSNAIDRLLAGISRASNSLGSFFARLLSLAASAFSLGQGKLTNSPVPGSVASTVELSVSLPAAQDAENYRKSIRLAAQVSALVHNFIASVRKVLGGVSKSSVVKDAESLTKVQSNTGKSIFSLAPPLKGLIASFINLLKGGIKNGYTQENRNRHSKIGGDEGENGRTGKSIPDTKASGDQTGSGEGDVESKEFINRKADQLIPRLYIKLGNSAKLGAHPVRAPPFKKLIAVLAAGLTVLTFQIAVTLSQITLTLPLIVVSVLSGIAVAAIIIKGGALCALLNSKVSILTTSLSLQKIQQYLQQLGKTLETSGFSLSTRARAMFTRVTAGQNRGNNYTAEPATASSPDSCMRATIMRQSSRLTAQAKNTLHKKGGLWAVAAAACLFAGRLFAAAGSVVKGNKIARIGKESQEDAFTARVNVAFIVRAGKPYRYIQTIALFTCVAVILYDKTTKTGILAHLPYAPMAAESIEKMIQALEKLGVKRENLDARVIGGKKDPENKRQQSEDLVDNIRDYLKAQKIAIVDEEILLETTDIYTNGVVITKDIIFDSEDGRVYDLKDQDRTSHGFYCKASSPFAVVEIKTAEDVAAEKLGIENFFSTDDLSCSALGSIKYGIKLGSISLIRQGVNIALAFIKEYGLIRGLPKSLREPIATPTSRNLAFKKLPAAVQESIDLHEEAHQNGAEEKEAYKAQIQANKKQIKNNQASTADKKVHGRSKGLNTVRKIFGFVVISVGVLVGVATPYGLILIAAGAYFIAHAKAIDRSFKAKESKPADEKDNSEILVPTTFEEECLNEIKPQVEKYMAEIEKRSFDPKVWEDQLQFALYLSRSAKDIYRFAQMPCAKGKTIGYIVAAYLLYNKEVKENNVENPLIFVFEPDYHFANKHGKIAEYILSGLKTKINVGYLDENSVNTKKEERNKLYRNCNIIYTIPSVPAFDYLIEELALSSKEQVLINEIKARGVSSMFDELQKTIGDEALTPLIITGGKIIDPEFKEFAETSGLKGAELEEAFTKFLNDRCAEAKK
ncbi:MAG: hypothetical protein M0R17_14175, partial [Candidatus Omnitrophica bacterium]|nr:hypothetical protein [Candidatus Omnitrophota bacterium]